MIKRFLLYSVFLIIFVFCVNITTEILLHLNPADLLDAYTTDSEAFRAMDFGENTLENLEQMASDTETDFYELITTFMLQNELHLSEEEFHPKFAEFQAQKRFLVQKKPVEFQKLQNSYKQILEDLQVFPVPKEEKGTSWVVYENSWGEARTYGGERKHEGTDLMAENNLRGYYPILSMTDGTVKKIGWLEKGGWRIGIQSPQGAYFYYAHLSDYFKDYQVGDTVKAGDILGFMGDSRYI